MNDVMRIGTRASRLALVQSELIAGLLRDAWPECNPELIHFTTEGDRTLDKSLPAIGGKGLFTAELEQALLSGRIDLAVHSLKDLPVQQPDGLALGAVVGREDVRDCLVAKNRWTLDTLPDGALVGTSSPRRLAQLQLYRPDITIRSVRGNVETRIRKALEGEYDAVVLAAAGLQRLGLTDVVTQWIPLNVVLPAPGQGALGVQCRTGDVGTLHMLQAIDDLGTRTATSAERWFLQQLGGGCAAPIAAYAVRSASGIINMHVFAEIGGRSRVRRRGSGGDPQSVSERLAKEVLASVQEQESEGASVNLLAPLREKRIVVTRAAEQAQSLVDALETAGAEVIQAPAIGTVPLDDLSALSDTLAQIAEYKWLVFTSANAVNMFMRSLGDGGFDLIVPKTVRVAAVGPATMDALAMNGIGTDLVPDTYLGTELATELEVENGDRILLPRSELGGDELPAILRERGAIVDDIPIYRPVATAPSEQAIQQLLNGVDMVTFTSGSTVRSFYDAVCDRPGLEDLLDTCAIACIGPKTAEAIRERGFEPAVIAEEHTVEGLVNTILSYYGAKRNQR